MSDYFQDVYTKRVNRYGLNYQSRRLNQRKEEFQNYLLKSSYRVDFEYDGEMIPATFEKNKQDETSTTRCLLTSVEVEIPNGEILWIQPEGELERPWMIWYMEDQPATPYNKYYMIKMTHYVRHVSEDQVADKLCYFYGEMQNDLADTFRSGTGTKVVYGESENRYNIVMPFDDTIKKEDILIIHYKDTEEQYKVTGFDIQSTKGIEYVSLYPTYKHDFSQAPAQTAADSDDDYFWLTGGDK